MFLCLVGGGGAHNFIKDNDLKWGLCTVAEVVNLEMLAPLVTMRREPAWGRKQPRGRRNIDMKRNKVGAIVSSSEPWMRL